MKADCALYFRKTGRVADGHDTVLRGCESICPVCIVVVTAHPEPGARLFLSVVSHSLRCTASHGVASFVPCLGVLALMPMLTMAMAMATTTTMQLRALVQQSDASGVQQKTASPYSPPASGGGDNAQATGATTTVSSAPRKNNNNLEGILPR